MNEQIDLFGNPVVRTENHAYSAPVRRGARETEKSAARSVKVEKTRRQVADVMELVRYATHEQLIESVRAFGYVISDSGVRSRCHELVEAGVVRDSGRKIPTKSGRASTVWQWVPEAERRAAS